MGSLGNQMRLFYGVAPESSMALFHNKAAFFIWKNEFFALPQNLPPVLFTVIEGKEIKKKKKRKEKRKNKQMLYA